MVTICDPQHVSSVSSSTPSRRTATVVAIAGRNGFTKVKGLPALIRHRSRGVPLVDSRLRLRWGSTDFVGLRCQPSRTSLSTEEEAQPSSLNSEQNQRREDSLKTLESLNSLTVEDSGRAPQNEQNIREEAGPSEQRKQIEAGVDASAPSANGHAEANSSEKPEGQMVFGHPSINWLRNFLGRLLASFLAVVQSLPWISRRKRLKQLTNAWESDKVNTDKMAALMAELYRQRRYEEAIDLVKKSEAPMTDAVAGEFLKALVKSNQISQFTENRPLRMGEDHRSLLQLLRELGSKAEGGKLALAGSPGATATRPLHIILQDPSRRGGGFWALLEGFLNGLATWVLAIISIGVLFLLGSATLSKTSSSPLSSGLSSKMAPTSVLSSSTGYAPKEYVKDAVPEKSQKTFKDVKGCDEAKMELQEIVEYLKNPEKFTRLGGKLPKGVLLTGPPGTGKTLLAKAVAGEAGVPFFFRAGSEFEEMFVGVGSRRVRSLFAAAKKKTPCIVFIDEIDAIGASRKMWENHSRKTLNQLLVEMDGFESTEGIIVIAATNLQESLDPALTRPGRFDRHVAVPLPDVRGRLEILKYYMEGKPLAPEVEVAVLARRTPGFSGADLSNMVNEAALLAAKSNADVITPAMLDEARDKILMGSERRSLVQSSESRKLTAYHESGHALVALNTAGAKPIHKATIVPRGHALGMVSQVPDKDEYNVTKQQLMADIDVSMGGKVAEEIIFGPDQVTTGARSDLQHATLKARHLVMECGMSDAVGPMFVERDGRHPLSSDTAKTVDAEIGRILRESYQKVKALLMEKEAELHKLAQALLENETLTQAEIRQVLDGTFSPKITAPREAPMTYEEFVNNPGTPSSDATAEPAQPAESVGASL